MTVRELVNELTKQYVNWDDEIRICVTDKPVKGNGGVSWDCHKVDRCDLYRPTWYKGDTCILVIGTFEKDK